MKILWLQEIEFVRISFFLVLVQSCVRRRVYNSGGYGGVMVLFDVLSSSIRNDEKSVFKTWILMTNVNRLREDLTAQSSELLSLQQRLRDSMLRVSEIESSQLPNELEHVKVLKT